MTYDPLIVAWQHGWRDYHAHREMIPPCRYNAHEIDFYISGYRAAGQPSHPNYAAWEAIERPTLP